MTENVESEPEPRVTDNRAERRYEVYVGDALAGFVTYHAMPGQLTFIHTEVDPGLRRRGLGSALARGALDDARAKGVHVVAVCPFIETFIEGHPEYADLVA